MVKFDFYERKAEELLKENPSISFESFMWEMTHTRIYKEIKTYIHESTLWSLYNKGKELKNGKKKR